MIHTCGMQVIAYIERYFRKMHSQRKLRPTRNLPDPYLVRIKVPLYGDGTEMVRSRPEWTPLEKQFPFIPKVKIQYDF